ncbi:MAG: hypothetical protein JRF33_03960 [Deltaproteobacteria bacterium]|nr:hypothetical protein [Deltaproteobacteria bacterium]
MRFNLVILVLMVSLVGLGCSGPQIRGEGWESGLEGVDASTMELLRHAGDRASLLVLLRPEQWKAAQAELALRPELLSGLERLLGFDGSLSKTSAASGIPAAVGQWIGLLSGKTFEAPSSWPGWDDKRPIVAALFEAQPDPSGLGLANLLPGADLLRMKRVGLRHRILVPAEDSKALLVTFRLILVSIGLKPEPLAASFPGLKGGVLCPLRDTNDFVALIPEDRWLRIELLIGNDPGLDTVDGGPNPSLKTWREILDQNPSVDSLPSTPALHYLASSPDFLGVYLRPWLLENLAIQQGTQMVQSVMPYADQVERPVLWAKGMSEVHTASLVMTPLGAEVDDIVMGLSFRDGIRLRQVSSLTRLGAEICRAGKQGRIISYDFRELPALMKMSIALDLEAMVDRAQVPANFDSKDPLKLIQAIQECGAFCQIHALARQIFGSRKALRGMDPIRLPKSLKISLLSFNPTALMAPDGGAWMELAMAADLPKGYDSSWLKKALAHLKDRFQGDERFRTKLLIEPGENHDTLLLGINTDPHEVFVRRQQFGPVAPFAFHLSPSRLPKSHGGTFLALGQVESRGALGERAIKVETTFQRPGEKKSGEKKSPPYRFANYGNLDWPSPGLRYAQSKGSACLVEVKRAMILALSALSYADSLEKHSLLVKAIEEIRPQLDCGLKDPLSKARAARIDEELTWFLAQLKQAPLDPPEQPAADSEL